MNSSDATATNTQLNPGDSGDGEKVLAMIVLGMGSFLFGMLPAVISDQNRRRFPLTTSILLCFGAGILLATALVHILPEVHEKMPKFAEVALCGGFFIIYFIDEFTHYFFGEAMRHSHSAPSAEVPAANRIHRGYGAISSEDESLLNSSNENSRAANHGHHHSHNNLPGQASVSFCDDEVAIAAANARICHTTHTEPCAQTNLTGTLGLFLALSLHSAIEGLAIGIQNSSTKVLFLLGAVACHKFVMGFCLGLEFRSNSQTSLRSHFIGITVFALGAVCGIGIGMIIVDTPAGWTSSALPIVQALAGGTLFYVTCLEVIPREKARWHQNAARKTAGFGQFLAVLGGFAAMTALDFAVDKS